MSKFTCPYCINTYSTTEVQYVCPDCGQVATPTGMEKIIGNVKCKQSGCGRIATTRRCPKCGHAVQHDSIVTPNLPFSIVGVSNSGKTNYITVMLHELGRAAKLRLALSAQDGETRNHQSQNKKLIYDLHTRPENTAAGESLPQIWRIKNVAKQRGNNVPTYTFTIFDGAGEDHENLDPNSVVCRYIASSKAIILTVDPLILESVRTGNIVDPNVRTNSLAGSDGSESSAEVVVNNVAQYLKVATGTKTNKKLKIPVAVVLTKFDTVINHPAFSDSALIKQEGISLITGKVDEGEFRQIDSEIRSWLEEIDETPFFNALDSNFQEFQFFGVSSFGEPPKDADTLNPIHPHRVLDPILWLFHKNGFVD